MSSVIRKLISIEVLIFNLKPSIVIQEPDEILQNNTAITQLTSQAFQPGVDTIKIFERNCKEKLIYPKFPMPVLLLLQDVKTDLPSFLVDLHA